MCLISVASILWREGSSNDLTTERSQAIDVLDISSFDLVEVVVRVSGLRGYEFEFDLCHLDRATLSLSKELKE